MTTKEEYYKGSVSIYKRSVYKVSYYGRTSIWEKINEFCWQEYEPLMNLIIKEPELENNNALRNIYLGFRETF